MPRYLRKQLSVYCEEGILNEQEDSQCSRALWYDNPL